MKTTDRLIRWKDTHQIQEVTFGIGEYNEEIDNGIFFWVDNAEELLELEQKNNGEEFYIID